MLPDFVIMAPLLRFEVMSYIGWKALRNVSGVDVTVLNIEFEFCQNSSALITAKVY